VYRQNTKNDKTRRIPITPRLMDLLQQRRFIGSEGYVFGDEQGSLVEDMKKPWCTVNLIAHGRKVDWTPGGNLSAKCWQDLREINLHWHDLRHKALSRLGESGELSDHELMEIAGHANLTTTQRYLNARIERLKQGVLRAAAKRLSDRIRLEPKVIDAVLQQHGRQLARTDGLTESREQRSMLLQLSPHLILDWHQPPDRG
jgi:integrase